MFLVVSHRVYAGGWTGGIKGVRLLCGSTDVDGIAFVEFELRLNRLAMSLRCL